MTPGKYYYGIIYVNNNGQSNKLEPRDFDWDANPRTNSDIFPSVTVITPDAFFHNPTSVTTSRNLGLSIAQKDVGQNTEEGTVAQYNPATGGWEVLQGDSYNRKQPLVLLTDWSQDTQTAANYNAGTAEAVADSVFASLVSLNEKLHKEKNFSENSLFGSAFHFIGFGLGGVVNSEIIQRFGNHGVQPLDLHMTTVDPFDDFRDGPKIKVWENVDFADNYYQEVMNPGNLPISDFDADLSVFLGGVQDEVVQSNSRAGFRGQVEENGRNPHERAAIWYRGTAALDLNGDNNTGEYQLLRRRGDFSQPEWGYNQSNFESAKNWYIPEYIEGDDDKKQWEGVGTGWFYSFLGNGIDFRPHGRTAPRVPLYEDNSATPRQRGDFAVPTLFNGNFDAISQFYSTAPVPGWSLHNDNAGDLKQSALREWSKIPGLDSYRNRSGYNPNQLNYALKLDSQLRTATHNRFVVPDWGNLRFDLHAPQRSGKLKVSIFRGQDTNAVASTIINLDETAVIPNLKDKSFGEIINIHTQAETQIGYGRQGFETFQLKLSNTVAAQLHGKVATVTFSLENGDHVYLDNVFFKSDHLALGNITEARWDSNVNGDFRNNLLLEKSQYVVSYNEERRNPNWVAWKVDSSWSQRYNTRLKDAKFIRDPDLPNDDWSPYNKGQDQRSVFYRSKLDHGHLIPDRDRNRRPKDQLSTYLLTNIIPQSLDNNRIFVNLEDLEDPHKTNHASAWYNLEQFISDRVNQGKQYYIFAGAFGHRGVTQKATNVDYLLNQSVNGELINEGYTSPDKFNNNGIKIPKGTWKVIIPVNDNDMPQGAFAYLATNKAEPESYPDGGVKHPFTFLGLSRNNIRNASEWRNISTWRLALSDLQHILNQQSDLPDFNFNVQHDLLELGQYVSPDDNRNNSASLSGEQSEGDIVITRGKARPGTAISGMKIKDSIAVKSISVENSPEARLFIFKTEMIFSSTISRSSQITSFENKFIVNSCDEMNISPITVNGSLPKIAHIHNSILEITPNQTWDKTTPPFTTGKIAVDELSATKSNTIDNSASEIDSLEFNPIQIDVLQNDTSEIPLTSSIPLQQLISSHFSNLHNQNSQLNTLLNNITLKITDLPSGQIAEAQLTQTDPLTGHPTAGTLLIDHNANGIGWFIDPTPNDHSEFALPLAEHAFQATPDSPAHNRYDLLTAINHELLHLLGVISGHQPYDQYRQNSPYHFTQDQSHLNPILHPHDLLNPSLKPGQRLLPSQHDLHILEEIYVQTTQNPSTQNRKNAPLTAGPLEGILNGDFSSENGWNTRGQVILSQKAILKEGPNYLSHLSQTFTIPQGVKALQIDLLTTKLGATKLAPPDALEIALLNAQTLTPLTSTIPLSHSDALFNLQADGTLYTSTQVEANPRTVTIDLTEITPGTQATLYFDLLGFGKQDAEISIDNIILINTDSLAPIAENDSVITQSNQPLTIPVLDNDRDSDGTLQPNTLAISTPPNHGTIVHNISNTLTYTPNPDFLGEDTFTYTVADQEGIRSNPATVTITVQATLPEITEILMPDSLKEGTPNIFSATAIDPQNSELTYTWDFNDGTSPVTGTTVTHTFPDNGTYNLTLTVTGSGGSTSQTFAVEVENVAPTVSAGEHLTLDYGETVTLPGSFTDPGILDTHTIEWDLGNGTILTDTLTPEVQYNLRGEYEATLTITDKDGASSSDTVLIKALVGKIIVANDEWTLSDTGFTKAPDTNQFLQNVTDFFSDGEGGKFLGYSNNFGITGTRLAQAFSQAGHEWTVSRNVPFNLETLLQYDGVFLARLPADNEVLIDYVNRDGNVYVAAGIRYGRRRDADIWRTFLGTFGLAYESSFNGIGGRLFYATPHPIFDKVERLYHNNGNSILDLDPNNDSSMIIGRGKNGANLYALYNGGLI